MAGETTRQAAAVEIREETESGRGWMYAARVVWMDDSESQVTVGLSWVDHDHLSGGAVAPSTVAEAVLRLAADELGPLGLPAKLDASTAMRRLEDFAGRVQSRLCS